MEHITNISGTFYKGNPSLFPMTYYQHVLVTPLERFQGPAQNWQALMLKDETKQRTGAFKFRGNFLYLLRTPDNSCVVTASTGNHGIGLSTAARILLREAHVFIPRDTPRVKQQAILLAGGLIHLVPGDYDSCRAEAELFARDKKALYVPSFDDPNIIEGHKSLFIELEHQSSQKFDVVFVPVGGGGLLSACLKYYQGTATKVVGVELDSAPAMQKSLLAGKRITLPTVRGKAEGLLVREIGHIPFQIAKKAKNLEICLVNQHQIMQAIKILWKNNHIKAEGAGSASLAAALHYPCHENEKRALCIISGGNIAERSFQEALSTPELENERT